MKKMIILLTMATISASALAQEGSWLDSLKNLVGLGDDKAQSVSADTPEMPSSDGLVKMLTSALDVNSDQASGGMGAIFNYVKNNVSTDQFSQLTQSLPGVDSLINQMPDISALNTGSSNSLSGLLEKSAEYNDTLKSINDVKNQFEALGLKPEMISSFISSAQKYLDTEQGQQVKQILTDGLSKLMV